MDVDRPPLSTELHRTGESLSDVLAMDRPEGLILTRIVAFRPQDQVAIDTLLTANRDEGDVALIRSEWSPRRD